MKFKPGPTLGACCTDFICNYVLGNVYNEKLLDIWKNTCSDCKRHWTGDYKKEYA